MEENDAHEYEYNFFASLKDREDRRFRMITEAKELEELFDAVVFGEDLGVTDGKE